ncbi:hypothetical protein Ddc_05872 [Ditylenchus destructor]|nr:hypothetical protein Ddc_05872 [Ditylenchus destructor]
MGNYCGYPPLKRQYELETTRTTTKWKKRWFSSKKKNYTDPHISYQDEAEKNHTDANIERSYGASSTFSKETIILEDCNSTVPLESSNKHQCSTAQKKNISGNMSAMQDSRSFHTIPTETVLVSPENCNELSGNQLTVISPQTIALDATQDDEALMSELSLDSSEVDESGNVNGQYSPERLIEQSGRITPMPTPLRKFDALSPGREHEVFRHDGRPAYDNKKVGRYIDQKRHISKSQL